MIESRTSICFGAESETLNMKSERKSQILSLKPDSSGQAVGAPSRSNCIGNTRCDRQSCQIGDIGRKSDERIISQAKRHHGYRIAALYGQEAEHLSRIGNLGEELSYEARLVPPRRENHDPLPEEIEVIIIESH